MLQRVLHWIAYRLAVAGVICLIVSFGFAIEALIDGFGKRRLGFDALFQGAKAARTWAITGLVLFASSCLVLWFLPDRGDDQET